MRHDERPLDIDQIPVELFITLSGDGTTRVATHHCAYDPDIWKQRLVELSTAQRAGGSKCILSGHAIPPE